MSTGAATRAAGAAVLGALIVLIPAQLHGQDDFLFGRPDATLSVYGGWAMPAEGSDLFEETRRELTVREGDFDGLVGMAEVAFRVNERVDVALGVSRSSRTVDSEMAEWEWADGNAIRQSTRFSQWALMGTGKFYLLPRGREVSRFAWIPYRWSPYIGGGAGISQYDFTQDGDFAVQLGDDPLERDILGLTIESSDRGFTAHALGGIQLSVTPRVLVRGEYRYIWGSADLEPDAFEGFEDIDLSGSSIMLGLGLRI